MELKPGYKQTEVGVIPDDWSVSPVGTAFNICNNLRMPISETVRKTMVGPYPYYGPTAIQGYINEYRVEGEYALIGEDGDHFLKWQDQPMTQLVSGRFNVNNHAHLIKGGTNLTGWFHYCFSRRDLTPYLTRQGAGRYKLTKRTLFEIPCALPSTKADQEAIIEALSDGDVLIASIEKLLAKKRDLKQGAMHELLTGRKRLPGFSKVWKADSLGNVAEIVMGQSPSSAFYNSQGEGLPLIQGNADISNRLAIRRIFTTQITKKGRSSDILLSVRAPVGEVSRALFDVCLGRGVCAVRYPNKFLYYALIAKEPSWAKLSKGSTFDSVTSTDVKAFEVELPSDEDEQVAIATVLSDMDVEIAVLEQKLTKARLLKLGMMQELLTGRIRLV